MSVLVKAYNLATYLVLIGLFWFSSSVSAAIKQDIKALYIPLADHYAALVALERYAPKMKYANFSLQQMPNWDLLRALFQEEQADMAFVMSPLALDMYREKDHFRWVGLMHRDGNGLAVNKVLNQNLQLSESRSQRKPGPELAAEFEKAFIKTRKATPVGVPHLLSTHTVVLYKYLKDHGLTLSLMPNSPGHVLAMAVPPPKSPTFVIGKGNRQAAAAIEQSLPWIDIVETGLYGQVAWYSKDILPSEKGHVECIAIASNYSLAEKNKAVMEVMLSIKKAGADIERARKEGGAELEEIVAIVQKHIPAHTKEAILASLDPHLRVINYEQLDVDIPAMQRLMDIALEGGILKSAVDLQEFAVDNKQLGQNAINKNVIDKNVSGVGQ